jgi:hypothetical protein
MCSTFVHRYIHPHVRTGHCLVQNSSGGQGPARKLRLALLGYLQILRNTHLLFLNLDFPSGDMERFLRSWRQDALNRGQHDSAIYIGDKVLALTSKDYKHDTHTQQYKGY